MGPFLLEREGHIEGGPFYKGEVRIESGPVILKVGPLLHLRSATDLYCIPFLN